MVWPRDSGFTLDVEIQSTCRRQETRGGLITRAPGARMGSLSLCWTWAPLFLLWYARHSGMDARFLQRRMNCGTRAEYISHSSFARVVESLTPVTDVPPSRKKVGGLKLSDVVSIKSSGV